MTENEIILTHILKCKPIDLLIDKPVLDVDQQRRYEDCVQKRAEGEPLQYILGTCNFMGLELSVNPAVLIPRPETEQLVDQALKVFKAGNALDLGCGSGNIAITLAKFVPGSQVVSVDVSAKALAVARANARDHGLEKRVEFLQQDLVEYLKSADSLFDLIISNPPYVPTEQLSSLPVDVQHEPSRALDGGADGLNFYRVIIKYTPRLLRSGAWLMMRCRRAMPKRRSITTPWRILKWRRLFR